jgi:uncharacterized damage-inducible protein DinB
MTISQMLLPEFDQEMANTRKILECVPENKLTWKPHEKSFTLGRLASHVAEMPQWVVATINQEKFEADPSMKPFNAPTKQELLTTLDKGVADARAAISGASDEHLGKTWSFIFNGQTVFAMPRAAVLRNMVMSHMVHHRGQLSVYLRLQDVAIPGMYGPSADEKM